MTDIGTVKMVEMKVPAVSMIMCSDLEQETLN